MNSKRLAFIKNGNVIDEYNQIRQNIDLMSDGEIGYLEEILEIKNTYAKLIIGLGNFYGIKTENNVRFINLSNQGNIKLFLLLKRVLNNICIFISLMTFSPHLLISLGNIYRFNIPFIYAKLFNKKYIPAITNTIFRQKMHVHKILIAKLALFFLNDNCVPIILSRGKYVKKELIENGIKKTIREYYPRYTYNFYKKFEVENIFRDEVFRVIFIGRIVKRKGIFKIIEIAKNLKKRNYKIRFIIIGDGEVKESLIEKIKDNDLENYVFYLGYRSNKMLFSYLKHSNLLLIPSDYESLCKVSIEGILCGIPMIVSNVGDLPLNVEDGLTGFVLDKDDISGFTEKIIEIYENKDLEDFFRKNLSIKRRELNEKNNVTFEKIISDFIKYNL